MEMKINLSYTKGKDGTCPISAELMTLSENHANVDKVLKSTDLYKKIIDEEITILDASYTSGSENIGAVETDILVRIIAITPIHTLNLYNNSFMNTDGLSVISRLCKSPNLKTLDISKCNIDQNLLKVIDHILNNTNIEKLNMNDNLGVQIGSYTQEDDSSQSDSLCKC